jgi:cell shape-determining protein MreC
MKLSELKENDSQLDEILPAVGAAVGGIARGAAAIGSTAAKGVQTVGSAVAKGAQAVSGLAGGQMDPAQAATAAKERMDQKKQVQDQIKQTEQQLTALRKQLAELG